jgi:hypothetical protein
MTETTDYLLGKMKGQLEGIGREIGDLKRLMECKTVDCEKCREGIDRHFEKNETYIADRFIKAEQAIATRLEKDEQAIKVISDLHVGEKAVKTWKDITIGQLIIYIGASTGLVLFGMKVWAFLTGGPQS